MDDAELIVQTLAHVPKGEVISYGELARQAGLPGKARYVGFVLKNLPNESKLPWHRVIKSDGKIAFPVGSDRYEEQLNRLQEEGLVHLNGKILVSK